MGRETGPKRAGRRFLRAGYFAVAMLAIPLGASAAVGQHSIGGAVSAGLGLVLLAMWYVLRERVHGGSARRWQRFGLLLSIGVAGAAEVGVTPILAPVFSATYTASPPTLLVSRLAGAAAVVLLLVRVLAGLRLRALARREAGVAPGPDGSARASRQASAERTEQTGRELRQLRDRWQRGEVQTGRSLTVEPDGTLVLSTDPAAVRAGEAGRMQPALAWGRPREVMRLTAAGVIARRLRGPRSIPRTDIDHVVLLSADLGSGRSIPAWFMLFVDRQGRCLLNQDVSGVPHQQRQLFMASLGVPAEVRDGAVGPEELRAEFPGSLSAWYEHQVLIGIVAAGLILVTVALIVYLTSGPGGAGQ